MTPLTRTITAERLAELEGIEQRATEAAEKALGQLQALLPRLEGYSDMGAMPTTQVIEVVVFSAGLTLLASVAGGRELLEEYFIGPLQARAQVEGVSATNPFTVARDAQFAAGPARYEIEQRLNAFSQGGIEQLAEALRAGGQLRVVVRR